MCVFFGQEAHTHIALPDFCPVLPEAMDSARLQMLQELMKEARATGELESSLAATSVLNSLNLVLGTKLVQNSDLVFSPRSKFSLKGLNLQD